ncbi:MAG: DUF4129 domain-containing protein [Actinomycetota bacterium]
MSAVDPDELRGVAERVLSDPEFRPNEPSLPERVLDRLGELLGELFELLAGGGAGSVVGWVLIGAALGGLVWLVVRLVPAARAGNPLRQVTAGRQPTVDIEAARTATAWDEEAEALEAAGRWDEALRARYRAVVARLARRGAVRDAPAVTTGEHREGLGADTARRPLDAEEFAASADRFDEVWYGGAEATRDDVDRTRRLAQEVDRAG